MSWRDEHDPTTRADLDRLRAEALDSPCPTCQAEAGQPCTNKANGQPLARLPAHMDRLKEVSI